MIPLFAMLVSGLMLETSAVCQPDPNPIHFGNVVIYGDNCGPASNTAKDLHTTYDFRAVDEQGVQTFNDGLDNPIGVKLPPRIVKIGYACVRFPIYRNEDGFTYVGFSCSDEKKTDGVALACRDDVFIYQSQSWLYLVGHDYAINFTVSCSTK